MSYWLFKSEPAEYGIDDLAAEPQQTTRWFGIRNYQARNLLRDQVKTSDIVLFYHSSCKPTAVVGIASVVTAAYPDPTQFDELSSYYDAKSSKENPRWICVDIQLKEKFKRPVELVNIKKEKSLQNMVLLNQGRLSIQPVKENEFITIINMASLTNKQLM